MQFTEKDVVLDAYFNGAVWCQLGTKIEDWGRTKRTQLALMNAVYLCSGKRLEQVLSARQMASAERRIPLLETTLRGAPYDSEQKAKIGTFTSCLDSATHFTGTATVLNMAMPSQVEVYVADLEAYTAASEGYRQKAVAPREISGIGMTTGNQNIEGLRNTMCGVQPKGKLVMYLSG